MRGENLQSTVARPLFHRVARRGTKARGGETNSVVIGLHNDTVEAFVNLRGLAALRESKEEMVIQW